MVAHERSFTVNDDVEVPNPGADEVWTVGAVILNREGRAFAQKRSRDRRLFPGAWDIVGGHVEEGETLLEALAREVEEETGWRLTRVRRFLGTTTWTGDDGGGLRHEADYLVEVDGDLDRPRLEWSKHSAYDWFGPGDLTRLKENRGPGEYLIHDLIAGAVADSPFDLLRADALTSPDQLRELYPQPNPNSLRKETDRLTEETRALIGCSSLVFIGSADREGRADVTPRGGPAGFVSVLDEQTLVIPDATGNKRLDTLHNVLETGRLGLLFLVPGRPTTLRINGRACVSARPELLARLTPVGKPPVTALVVQVEQVYPHCPKSLMRADAWRPEQWLPADAQPSSAEVTLAQLNLPGLTLDRIEDAERESLRLRYE
ncbi:hypothetical protein SAMN05428941_6032 [Streptomyces sp. 2114.2]|nr:NUDIX domain-containing protein [Streptomyces sp. RK76]REH24133.1 hypothetical protein BX268_6044 [Streptomyces sp. 2221.1]SDT77217.1 hypothetical protein SAMN05428941_6032 [Streptomyces sp. 2114.2]